MRGKKADDSTTAINLLTPDVVREARGEIQTGRHVQLDWPLHSLAYPSFGRKTFDHKVISLKESLATFGFDDEIHINTQSGSQWDSLRHVRFHPRLGCSRAGSCLGYFD